MKSAYIRADLSTGQSKALTRGSKRKWNRSLAASFALSSFISIRFLPLPPIYSDRVWSLSSEDVCPLFGFDGTINSASWDPAAGGLLSSSPIDLLPSVSFHSSPYCLCSAVTSHLTHPLFTFTHRTQAAELESCFLLFCCSLWTSKICNFMHQP